jgi:hypothetical protein
MIVIPWQGPSGQPYTRAELEAMVNPTMPNQPEAVPWALYDQQNLTTAVATPNGFFIAQNADKTLSNLEGPGQLPDPQYFIVHYASCDIQQIPVATALANEPNSALANVENILKTCRTTFEFSMSNKLYGPFPLSMCHATGGATGSGFGYGTAANGTSTFVVNNGIPGSGGFPFAGALVIPPKIGFSITLRNTTAYTLVGGPIGARMTLVGTLYRRVA